MQAAMLMLPPQKVTVATAQEEVEEEEEPPGRRLWSLWTSGTWRMWGGTRAEWSESEARWPSAAAWTPPVQMPWLHPPLHRRTLHMHTHHTHVALSPFSASICACPQRAAKRWSAVATMAKTRELKKRPWGRSRQKIVTSVLERAVSRERLFLFSAAVGLVGSIIH